MMSTLQSPPSLARSLARCLCLGLCLLAPVRAIDPGRALSQYHKRHWQIEDGLPHNYVNAIAHATDGYLLVGTDEGLARFDGVRFSPVQLDAALHLDRRWIMGLAPSRGGGYWASTYDGAVYLLRGGAAQVGMKFPGAVHGLFEDSRGDVWFDSGGIYRARDGKPEAIPIPGANHFGGSWAIFAEAPAGGIWIARNNGLYRWRDGRIEQAIHPLAHQGRVLSVMSEADGTLWAGTSNGVYRVSENALVRQSGVDGPVSALLRDRDRVLWAATWGKGLCRITSGSASCWTARDGLSDDFIRTLFEDREGNLWFGSRSGGLTRWKDTLIEPFGIPEGLRGNFASAVSGDARGNLWLGTYRSGLYRLRDGSPARQPTPIPELDLVISALAGDAAGNLWMGTWHGLFRYNDRGYTNYSQEIPPGCIGPQAIVFDTAHRLWLGCGDGLYRYDSGVPQRGGAVQVIGGSAVRSLVAASDGSLWAGSNLGLSRVTGGHIEAVSGLPDRFVRYLSEDSRGRIWATTEAPGICLIAQGKARVLDQRHGLPAHAIYKVLDDGSGNLWLSSPRGIVNLPAAQVDEWVAGRRETLDATVYDLDDGMRSIECHGVAQPGGWRHGDGSLWFPTVKGFVRVLPHPRRPLPPPQVVFEDTPLSVRLNPGAGDLEVRFTALRFGSPDHLRFRYRLEGADGAWVDAGGARTVRFNNLQPGAYRLQLAARDPGGEWSPQPAELAIEQLPRFHQTWLFKLLLAAALLLIAALAYHRHVTNLKGRYAAVVMERNRIAREWHDTLLAGLSGLAWQLQAARSRLISQPEHAPQALELAQRMVDHCQSEARRVIWDLRDGAEPSEPLPDAISSFLHRQREGRAIQGSVETIGSFVKLPHDLEQNALRVGQEAISNAVRHAAPSRIAVVVEYTAKQLMLRVSDDGRGFVPEQRADAAGHFGILGVRERVLNFGGRFQMTSSPGEGTVVEAVFPLQLGASS